jgi:hypothetical protein
MLNDPAGEAIGQADGIELNRPALRPSIQMDNRWKIAGKKYRPDPK